MKITIGHLYPDLLNLYGDRGNIQCLMKRCLWRGIEAETIAFELGDKIDFSKLDIVLLGGGSDREQMLVCEKLKEIQKDFKAYVENYGVVIAICGGYQLLGKYYQPHDGEKLLGIGVLDAYTVAGDTRFIGNVTAETDFLEPKTLVGFENHAGLTYLEEGTVPLAKVVVGNGNNSKDGGEGARKNNVFGTYLHGSVLPKNPHFTDYLIKTALEVKYHKPIELEKLDDTIEMNAHNDLINKKY